MIIDDLIKYKNEKITKNKESTSGDKEYSYFEMYRKKYDRSYYIGHNPCSIQPFINQMYLNRTDFWDDTHFDAKKLPRLSDNIYKEIKHFPDYDYLNSIAYEMLIRTEKYNVAKDNIGNKSSEEGKVEFDQLGIDINDVFDLEKISDHFSTDATDKSFTNSYFSMTISDLEYALDRLIKYYVNKKQVYVIDHEEKMPLYGTNEENIKDIILSRTYKVVDDITIEDVKSKLSNYYIPVKYNFKEPTLQEKFCVIDKAIPLVALEHEFLRSIDDLIPNRIKGSIDFNFTRPLLRFKEMPIVDVPLNLNLSVEELTQLVRKLKDDFEEGVVNNPINILYDTKFEFKDLKDITPFKMTRETIAEAFFIYDLYQFINGAVELHKKKIKHFKELDIQEIKNKIYFEIKEKEKEIPNKIEEKKKKDGKVDKWFINNCKSTFKQEKRKLHKEKEKMINNTKKLYRKYLMEYKPKEILEDIADIHNLTPYMCKQYLKFMRKYIGDMKYKELIIGIKS